MIWWILTGLLGYLLLCFFVQLGGARVRFNNREVDGPVARTLVTAFVYGFFILILMVPLVIIGLIIGLVVRSGS